MNKINKILIVLIVVLLVVVGIRFIQYKSIKYQETNRETVVKEEIERKAEDKISEKEPIEFPKQEENEEEGAIMIF